MSEDQAPYPEKPDPLDPTDGSQWTEENLSRWEAQTKKYHEDLAEWVKEQERSTQRDDPFGAKAVWQSHYDLAIETMHPISAVKAANAAALAYAEGNHYISMGGKGDAAEYRMVSSKEVGR